jgi:hypothetical protein
MSKPEGDLGGKVDGISLKREDGLVLVMDTPKGVA